jgi:hypothetical protein
MGIVEADRAIDLPQPPDRPLGNPGVSPATGFLLSPRGILLYVGASFGGISQP